MKLTREEFDKKFENGSLKIAFVGMSNVGKSFRANELVTQKNFKKVSVDDLIGESLALEKIVDLASWMGFPYETKFEKNQAKYLKLEEQCTKDSINHFVNNQNFVLDTTGSVIYLDEKTQKFLKNNFLVIGFRVPQNMIEEMTQKFFDNPKPLVWGNCFNQQTSESEEEALRRNYPALLTLRSQQYEDLADIALEFYKEKKSDIISCDAFLELVRKTL